MHNLMLSPFVGGYENSCHGCMLPISDPFYYCSECGFFLHKACAELPKMMNVWHHDFQEPLALISDKAFKCQRCLQISNAFAYECCGFDEKICLRCVIALTPGAQTCLKHEHPLFLYREATRGNAMLVVNLHVEYFVVRIAILSYILIVFHFQLQLATNAMSIFFRSLIMMITVIQKVIIVISAKKVEIQIVGFIIVQHAILLLMLIVFLENIHSSNSGASMKKQVIHTHSPL
ncbi:hypothetical protein Godav_012905 [Gossypium davidsonii]|uniref:DC1 domain-containing protein n=1 Tax=Gossypium davidsonii TaxID=34287 RepID=A0A7J8REX5_GOSDV|nr:hypothetical protein [Gossypium davidsonii]